MNRILQNSSALIFFIAVTFLFSILLPPSTSAVTLSAQKNWEVTVNNGPLFEPFVQSDGSLIVGTGKIIDNVYHVDIMSLTTEGEKSEEWHLTANTVFAAGKASSPVVVGMDETKGIVTGYSPSGEKKWKINLQQTIKSGYWNYYTDEKGRVYISISDNEGAQTILNVISVTTDKLLYTLKDTNGNLFLGDNTIYQSIENEKQMYKTKINKYSSTGNKIYTSQPFAKDKNRTKLETVTMLRAGKLFFIEARFKYDTTKLYALDEKGKAKWAYQTDTPITSDILESENNIFFLDSTYYYKLNALNGKLIKKTKLKNKENIEYSIVSESNGEVFSIYDNSNDTHFLKFNNAGRIAWAVNLKDFRWTSGMFIINEKIYIIPDYESSTVKIYDKNGKNIDQIMFEEGTGKYYLTKDTAQGNVFVTKRYYDWDTDSNYKTVIVSIKQ